MSEYSTNVTKNQGIDIAALNAVPQPKILNQFNDPNDPQLNAITTPTQLKQVLNEDEYRRTVKRRLKEITHSDCPAATYSQVENFRLCDTTIDGYWKLDWKKSSGSFKRVLNDATGDQRYKWVPSKAPDGYKWNKRTKTGVEGLKKEGFRPGIICGVVSDRHNVLIVDCDTNKDELEQFLIDNPDKWYDQAEIDKLLARAKDRMLQSAEFKGVLDQLKALVQCQSGAKLLYAYSRRCGMQILIRVSLDADFGGSGVIARTDECVIEYKAGSKGGRGDSQVAIGLLRNLLDKNDQVECVELDDIVSLDAKECKKFGLVPKLIRKTTPQAEEKAKICANAPPHIRERQAQLGTSTLVQKNSLKKWEETLHAAAPVDVAPSMVQAGVLDLGTNEGFEVAASCLASAVRDEYHYREAVWEMLDAHCKQFKGYDAEQNRTRFDSFVDDDYGGEQRTFGTLKYFADIVEDFRREAAPVPVADRPFSPEFSSPSIGAEIARTEANLKAANDRHEDKLAQEKYDYQTRMTKARPLDEVQRQYVYIHNPGGKATIFDKLRGAETLVSDFKSKATQDVKVPKENGEETNKRLSAVVCNDPELHSISKAERVECRYDNAPNELYPIGGGLFNQNSFKGFDIDNHNAVTVADDKWGALRGLLRDVIAQEGQEAYDYLINYMAWLVQNPGKKPKLMLVLRGKQGSGKSTVGEILSALFAPYAKTVSSADDLFGTFNGYALDNTKIVILEEAMWVGNPQHVDRAKELITGDEVATQKKHMGSKTQRSAHVFVSMTNHDWVVPASADARRFVVLTVDPVEAWGPCSSNWDLLRDEDEGIDMALMKQLKLALMKRNLPEGWHPAKDRISTGALQEQKRLSMSAFDSMLDSAFNGETAAMVLVQTMWPDGKDKASRIVADGKGQLTAVMNAFRVANRDPYDRKSSKIWSERYVLKQLKKIGCTMGTSNNGRTWELPDFETAKRLFAEEFGIDFK